MNSRVEIWDYSNRERASADWLRGRKWRFHISEKKCARPYVLICINTCLCTSLGVDIAQHEDAEE